MIEALEDERELIFEGDHSLIYRQREPKNGKLITVKLLKEIVPPAQQLAQFNNEFEMTSQLAIPGIRRALRREIIDQRSALVLEYFEGEPVRKIFRRKNYALERFLRVAIQAAETLGHIHRSQIIHKDISGNNLLLNPETDELCIIDFGISSPLDEQFEPIQALHDLEGTLPYIAPEQTGRMNRSVDYRADLYSLGVTFYEMLTGQLPFISDDPVQMVHYHLAQRPTPPHKLAPEVPEMLSRIVLRLMEKNAEDRYQSAFGLKADLERCLHDYQSLGRVVVFSLGESDFSSKFHIPEKLYGRQAELDILLEALEQSMDGATRVVSVTGFSGVGKSALVGEVHRPMVEVRGYFLGGKFDQYQRNVPYVALIQAFNRFVQLLLVEPESKLAQWRMLMERALAPNGKVLTEVIPDLEMIIGPQEPVRELPPREAQNRFNFVFSSFIRALCQKSHPIVLFLDDMQWADLATVGLLNKLLLENPPGHLLVILGYRHNEVASGHPLLTMLDQLREQGQVRPTLIQLNSLLLSDVAELISDTLQITPEEAAPLSELVYGKTSGNAFFVNQFLKSLHEEKLLTFRFEDKKWHWDREQIEAAHITDDVASLLKHKIERLKPSTQGVLELAACIGTQFDLATLSSIYARSPQETFDEIWQAVKEGLILPTSDHYKYLRDADSNFSYQSVKFRFLHDRVRQTVYQQLGKDQQCQLHFRIARIQSQQHPPSRPEDIQFELVNHFNLGSALLESEEWRERVSTFNLWAGLKAQRSSAYDLAFDYFQSGLGLLDENCWKRHYSLTFNLYLEAARTAYLSGQPDRMEEFLTPLFQHSQDQLDRVEGYLIRIQAHMAKNMLDQAIQTALEALKMLGMRLPESPNKVQTVKHLLKLRFHLRGKTPQDLEQMPEITDPRRLAVIRVMSTVSLAAFLGAPKLYPVLIFKQLSIFAQHGNTDMATYAYSSYGIILCGVLGDLETGYAFGQLAFRMLDKYKSIKQETRTRMVFNGFIRHWKEPIKDTLQPLVTAYQKGLETGSFEYGAYAAYIYCFHLFISGRPLPQLIRECETYAQAVLRIGQTGPGVMIGTCWQMALNLSGESSTPVQFVGEGFNENEQLAPLLQKRNKTILAGFFIMKMVNAYLMQDLAAAKAASKAAPLYIDGIRGSAGIPLYYFYSSLLLLAMARERKRNTSGLLKRVAANQKKMLRWADACPANSRYRYYLVEAELDRFQRRNKDAETHYNRAIELAHQQGYIQDEALAYELFAQYWQEQKQQDIAAFYLKKSAQTYQAWGAKRKCEQLYTQYPDLFAEDRQEAQQKKETLLPGKSGLQRYPKQTRPQAANGTLNLRTTSGVSSSAGTTTKNQQLDIATLMKASQALAESTQLEALLRKVLQIAMENAGAEKGTLIVQEERGQFVQARSFAGSDETEVIEPIPIEDCDFLALSVVNYVVRTTQPLVLNNAFENEMYRLDDYIKSQKPKSILCYPILSNQQEIRCIFYLENNLITGAFSEDRLKVLNMLSAQVAISIENARLYENLEQKVADRTQKLEAANVSITEQNKRITDSLRYAQTIQRAILPTHTDMSRLFADYFVIYRPKDMVSGDFYWLAETDDYRFLAVVDCTGHGVPGAFMSMISYSILNEIVKEQHVYQPGAILHQLNAGIQDALHQEESNNADGLDISICRLAQLNEHEIEVIFAGAKRPLYHSEGFLLQEIKGDRQSIGGRQRHSDQDFTDHTLILERGYTLYLTTDGFVDQCNEKRRKFGTLEFKRMLFDLAAQPMHEQRLALEQALDQHQDGSEQRDDITVLGVRL